MGNSADIFGDDIATTFDEGVGLRCQCQVDGGTRRAAIADHVGEFLQLVVARETRGEHDVGDIVLNLLVEIDLTAHLTGTDDVLGLDDWINLGSSVADILTEDEFLFFFLGIVDHHLQHETVHLSLRQRIGTFLFDGVLCSHHEEGVRQLEGLVADGHLMFLHGFEQGALNLGGRTVDFIGQDEIGEDGATASHELFVFLAVDQGTDQVGRQQVGGKLNTAEVGINRLSHRLDGKGLGQARHAFEQDVSVGQKADQQTFGHLFLSYDDLVHLQVDQVDKLALTLDFLIQFTNVSFNHCYSSLVVFLIFRFPFSVLRSTRRALRQKVCKITYCQLKKLLFNNFIVETLLFLYHNQTRNR